MLRRFKLSISESDTPKRNDLFLKKATNEEQELSIMYPFRELVGSLMYLACRTRPDIMFSVAKFARHFSSYSRIHWEAAKNVTKYVSSTRYLALCYGITNHDDIGFTNADWAGDRETRKSSYSYVHLMSVAAFWSSKCQSIVAAPSQGAEYVAQAMCIRQELWVDKLMSDFEVKIQKVDIRADNQGAIALAHTLKASDASNHIAVAYHLISLATIAKKDCSSLRMFLQLKWLLME